jgi:PAS domain S-box-containing protein
MRGEGAMSVLAHSSARIRPVQASLDFREIIDALPAAIYTTDAEGRITHFNQACVQFSGRTPVLGSDHWCVTWKLYYPDGRPMPHDECPMAIALKEGRVVRGVEAIAERPDGTRIWFEPYPTPLRDEAGNIIGGINMLVDITERKRADTVRLQLAAIVESSDDAIVSKDLNGIVTSWNRGARQLFGYEPAEMIGRPITTIIPPDRQHEEVEILGRIRRGEPIDHFETVRQAKDGRLLHISLSVSPVKDDAERIIGAAKIARDITERKRAEEQQRLLLREMNHRVKNFFAVAGSLVTMSARSAQTTEELATTLRDRLGALMRANELVRPAITESGSVASAHESTLDALLSALFAPYMSDSERRIVVDGPLISIGSSAATALALVLHELGTNAVKYGALSAEGGSVEIAWHGDGETVRLEWTERGGPALVGPPEEEGFGSKLARMTVTAQLGGEFIRDWQPSGLVVRLAVPKNRLVG